MTHKQNVWWREYRKRLYKPNVRNMSVETVLRINLKKTSKEYIENCSLSAIQRMCDRKQFIYRRIITLLLFCMMLVFICIFLQNLWFDYLSRPLIVTTDSTPYPISNIEFPAVTLCNFNRISKKALEAYVNSHYEDIAKHNESKAEVASLLVQLGRLIDYSYNKTLETEPLLLSLTNYFHENNSLVDLMELLAPPCDQMLVRCTWAGVLVKCESIFAVRRTVRGHCCAFNLVDGDKKPDETNNTFFTIKRQLQPGQHHGLNVILDPMVGDYTYTTFNMFGFEVLLFDATHFADPTGGNMIQRNAQPGHALYIDISAIKQIATKEVRKYPSKTRKCLFHDEMKDQFHNLYSYSTCIVKCRIQAVKSLCKCTPYYYATTTDHGPICTIDHLKCLNKYKEKLHYLYPQDVSVNTEGLEMEFQYSIYCAQCLPDCELTRHYSKHSKILLADEANQNKEIIKPFFNKLNMSGLCLLSVYQGTTDGILQRLDIVSYWFEVVSNVGGFCGILVGFSLISIVEYLYFFIIRYLWNWYRMYHNYHLEWW